jgi:hypothetical protein
MTGRSGIFHANTFFAIFHLLPSWSFDQLPSDYLSSLYMSINREAILSHFSSIGTTNDEVPGVDDEDTQVPSSEQNGKQVSEDQCSALKQIQHRARSYLKQAENLTYLCKNTEALQNFSGAVEKALHQLQRAVPTSEEGLSLLPARRKRQKRKGKNQSVSGARKRRRVSAQLGALPLSKRNGKKAPISSKRVGQEADRLRRLLKLSKENSSITTCKDAGKVTNATETEEIFA